MTRLSPQPFMTNPETVKLMAVLGEARFVGGVVRNALLGKPVSDIDVATPHPPEKVRALLEAAGLKAVPTGIEHGTITAVVNGKPFEVTTLRRDVETDGRRAVVAFTTDWAEDAQRRDFTMNALYADRDGEVYDHVGGVADLEAGRVRFVGDPAARIREDYLRILRLFRFHAWYGQGGLDVDALVAVEQEKAGLAKLSGERIAKEMLKLLEAANPVAVLVAMGETGVLAEVLPGAPDIMRLKRLAAADASAALPPDGVLRLAALLPRDKAVAQAVAKRWKLSNAHTDRLTDLAEAGETVTPYLSTHDVAKLLYKLGPERFRDRVRLAWAEAPQAFVQWRTFLASANEWQRPVFPLSGDDVMAAGVVKGRAVGQVLSEVESWWIENGFTADIAAVQNALRRAVEKVR
ncbi:CCA tRNA nucleotidyltransferase [Rhizomicrobium electricum]|uniref:CCA tRNA nucleotidyltransferase n=2 Tax=Rhizomicrobium electricum TaxID=480070 RepID=A0ABN1EUR3_9PROT|nr:CCA tRNA nucleotidyltransferase [Rhizomicrobium electricum]